MLNEEICKLRDELNNSITSGKDYNEIYEISTELDRLIAMYYRKSIKDGPKRKRRIREKLFSIVIAKNLPFFRIMRKIINKKVYIKKYMCYNFR